MKVETLQLEYSNLCDQQKIQNERLEAEMADRNGTVANVDREIKEKTESLKNIQQMENEETVKWQSRVEEVRKLEADVAQQKTELESIKTAIITAKTEFEQRRKKLENDEAKAKTANRKQTTESQRLVAEASRLKKMEADLEQKEEKVDFRDMDNAQKICQLKENNADLEVQRSELKVNTVVLLECVDVLRRQTLSIR